MLGQAGAWCGFISTKLCPLIFPRIMSSFLCFVVFHSAADLNNLDRQGLRRRATFELKHCCYYGSGRLPQSIVSSCL